MMRDDGVTYDELLQLTPPYTLLYFKANNFNPTWIQNFLLTRAGSYINGPKYYTLLTLLFPVRELIFSPLLRR
jgi:hypothetical protein